MVAMANCTSLHHPKNLNDKLLASGNGIKIVYTCVCLYVCVCVEGGHCVCTSVGVWKNTVVVRSFLCWSSVAVLIRDCSRFALQNFSFLDVLIAAKLDLLIQTKLMVY